MLFTRTNRMSARFFAIITAVSLILSAFPASVLIAEAADTLIGPIDVTVDNTGEYTTGSIDASNHENLELSFDYDAEELDGGGGGADSFTYGWRITGTDTDLGTVNGIAEPGTVGDESDHVSVSLPSGAEVADLEIYISVVGNTTASDRVFITNLEVTGDSLDCTPQTNVTGPTEIENVDTGEYFDTLQDAVDDCDTVGGHQIEMTADTSTDAQVTINKAITLEGNGFTLAPAFAKTDNSNNAAIGIIDTDDVTIQNLVIDGSTGTNLHGINVYVSEAIVIENVTINDISNGGIIVNGSAVDVADLTTSGSGWYPINVAQGSGVTDPAVLTIGATSVHDETWPPIPHIFIDDTSQDATVIDSDEQYDFTEFPLVAPTIAARVAPPSARAYFLKTAEPGLTITMPESDGKVLAGTYDFKADYTDEDDVEDDIKWAIRFGADASCSGGTNIAGNVGGLSDPSSYSTTTGLWHAIVDMSDWDNGDYCLAVNPIESGDGEDFRGVRTFTLKNKEPQTCEAGVNLVKNGSFEKPTVTNKKLWDILPLKKWKSEAVADESPIDVEIQRGYNGWVSADGEQHVELDGEENTRIWQKVKTIPGEEYTLSWKYSARPETDQPDSKMKVFVDGTKIDTNNQNGGSDVAWKSKDYTFVATKKKTEISFAGAGTSNSLGALVDDVALECNPPEPASLEITKPETDDETLDGEYTFKALYKDDDDQEDDIKWAIRFETCDPDDSATVAGNVGGFSDDSEFSSTTGDFTAMVDMSTWADGEYCFVVNPDEGEGEDDLRATRPFYLDNPEPTVCVPDTNLLANASFEEPEVKAKSGWDILAPVAWIVNKVSDSTPADMELHRTVNGWSHSDGEQHTELAGNEADIISQSVPTALGETYTLSWDYSPRPGKAFDENKMEVFIDGVEVDQNQESGVGLSDTDWSTHSYQFVGTGGTVEVAFKDAGANPSKGVGPFLDNTSLVCGDPEEEYYLVDGYKFEDEYDLGWWDKGESGLAGWTIEITDGTTTYSTTTDMYGYYWFEVPEGEWKVSEVWQYGWEQTAPMAYDDIVFAIVTDDVISEKPIDEVYPGTCEFYVGGKPVMKKDFRFIDDKEGYTCDFGNHYIAETVDGYKWNDIDGDGEWDEETEEGIAGWTIEITDGTTTFSTTTDEYGYYYFEVEPGEWTVSEGARDGWTQTYPVDPSTCTFDVENMKEDKTRLAIIDDGPYDYGYQCDFGNQYEGTTNSDASLTCNIEADYTVVREDSNVRISWESTGGNFWELDDGSGTTSATETGTDLFVVTEGTTFTLTVLDESEKESIDCSVTVSTESGNGTGGSSRSGGSSSPSGQVLGAATSADEPQQCGMYLNSYMRQGLNNDLTEVVKLQSFLRNHLANELLITGTFGSATDAAVRTFQGNYQSEVLQPWADLGFGDGTPTGYVFKTTRWKINNIVCPGSEAMPDLP